MEDIQPVEAGGKAILFFRDHIANHGGVELFRDQYLNHLLSGEKKMLGAVTENLYEAARSGQHDFQDEADLDAEAFIEGFAFGVGIISNYNYSRGMFATEDSLNRVCSNVLDTCDRLRDYSGDYNGADHKPIDVLHAVSKLGFKLFDQLEDYIAELLQETNLQPDALRLSQTRAGVGFAANFFASLEHLDEKTREFDELKPTDDDWSQFTEEYL